MSDGLNDKWKVYKDPATYPPDKLLIGHKGESFLDAGYVYSPYIPLQTTGSGFHFPEPAPCAEPSVIDRIGSLDDPNGPLAKRIADWDAWVDRHNEAFREWLKEHPEADPNPPTPGATADGPSALFDPSDFQLRKGLRTRFAKKVITPIAPNIGTINVQNL